MNRLKELRLMALKLAARAQGVRAYEMPHPASYSWKAINSLVRDGLLHKAKIRHKYVVMFDSAARAEAYMRKHGGAPALPPTVRIRERRAPRPDSEPIIPPGVKVTICPSPGQRFEAVELPTMRGQSVERSGGRDYQRHQRAGRF